MSSPRSSRTRDGPAGDVGGERGHGRERVALRLLAAEPAAHPQARDDDLAAGEPEHLGHDALRLARVLRGHRARDVALGVDVRPGGVGLQVEVVLRAGPDLALEHVRRPVERVVGVAAQDPLGLGVDAAGRERGVDAEHRGQRLVGDLDRRGAAPGGVVGLGDDPADGVADVVDDLGGQQLLVGGVAGAVVERRGCRRGRGRGRRRARARAAAVSTDDDPGVGVRRQDRPAGELAGGRELVVGVDRAAGDVADGALVRARGSRAHATGPVTRASASRCSAQNFSNSDPVSRRR